jgi:hypothetical protein
MFEDEWGVDNPDEMPSEFMEKIRLAFLIVHTSQVMHSKADVGDKGDKDYSEYVYLKVLKEHYEEFLSPMTDHTIQ